jgi:ketosteroid isomerase-like protein
MLISRIASGTALMTAFHEECAMADRGEIEKLLLGLYAARVRGDLPGVCASFTEDARFEIAGASNVSPLAMAAVGAEKYRPLLAVMIRTFKLKNHEILSLLIDGAKAAVHWRAEVHSRITGGTVSTEFVDVIEIRDGRIGSYTEFFVPR